MSNWKFVTNHGAALLLISQEERITSRELARRLHITERSVQKIVKDLEAAGYLSITKIGRANSYAVSTDLALRHPGIINKQVLDLLKALT